jgi:hypothetical protein
MLIYHDKYRIYCEITMEVSGLNHGLPGLPDFTDCLFIGSLALQAEADTQVCSLVHWEKRNPTSSSFPNEDGLDRAFAMRFYLPESEFTSSIASPCPLRYKCFAPRHKALHDKAFTQRADQQFTGFAGRRPVHWFIRLLDYYISSFLRPP